MDKPYTKLGADVRERGWLSVMYHYLLHHHMGVGEGGGEVGGEGVLIKNLTSSTFLVPTN